VPRTVTGNAPSSVGVGALIDESSPPHAAIISPTANTRLVSLFKTKPPRVRGGTVVRPGRPPFLRRRTNRPAGRRPDSSPKGFTVAGQCRICTGLRSCVLNEKPPSRSGPNPETWPAYLLGFSGAQSTPSGPNSEALYTPSMRSRMARLLSAALVIAVGLIALRRSGSSEVPVSPGSWDPAD